MSLKEQYYKLLADSITVSVEDLTANELAIMVKSFDLFLEKIEEIKLLSDDNKRLYIQLANLQSSLDNSNYFYEEDYDEFKDSHDEQTDHDENK